MTMNYSTRGVWNILSSNSFVSQLPHLQGPCFIGPPNTGAMNPKPWVRHVRLTWFRGGFIWHLHLTTIWNNMLLRTTTKNMIRVKILCSYIDTITILIQPHLESWYDNSCDSQSLTRLHKFDQTIIIVYGGLQVPIMGSYKLHGPYVLTLHSLTPIFEHCIWPKQLVMKNKHPKILIWQWDWSL